MVRTDQPWPTMRENQLGFGLDAGYCGDIAAMPAMFFPGDMDVSHGSTPGLETVGMATVCHAHAGRPPTRHRRHGDDLHFAKPKPGSESTFQGLLLKKCTLTPVFAAKNSRWHHLSCALLSNCP